MQLRLIKQLNSRTTSCFAPEGRSPAPKSQTRRKEHHPHLYHSGTHELSQGAHLAKQRPIKPKRCARTACHACHGYT
eukprot:5276205-Pyramimonas_sp.AAC.1